MDNEIRPAVAGCLLGYLEMPEICDDCARCGHNPKVVARRKASRRRNESERLEIMRLREARPHTAPDRDGWYSVKWALPELLERVIVTDGVFVGEAYLGANGWTRFGAELPSRELGVFGPIAWMPMPQPLRRKKGQTK